MQPKSPHNTIVKVSPFLILGAIACGGSSSGPPTGATPTTGSIVIFLSSTGTDLDDSGYWLVLDGEVLTRLPVNGSQTLPSLEAGPHVVQVENVDNNCVLTNRSKTVTVAPGESVEVSFTVVCTAVADMTGITTMDLGPMPGASETRPHGISDDGAIAGWAEVGSRPGAFYRSPSGMWIDLNRIAEDALGLSTVTAAWDMSNGHRVVGTVHFNSPSQRPVYWEQEGPQWKLVLLPGLDEYDRGVAFGINKSGDHVVGFLQTSTLGSGRTAIWGRIDGEWVVHVLGGTGEGLANDVNDADPVQVTGRNENQRATVWTWDGAEWLPEVLETPAGFLSEGRAINDNGDVAGELLDVASRCAKSTPVLWKRSAGAWKLVVLSEEIHRCDTLDRFGNDPRVGVAYGINNAGHVVGAYTFGGQRPFVWRGDGMQLLERPGVAWAINGQGEFVGTAMEEYHHAVVWERN